MNPNEAHGVFANQMMLAMLNSMLRAGYIDADSARGMVQRTVDFLGGNNPQMAEHFQMIGRAYLSGIEQHSPATRTL
jgi:hypothetical protein